MMSYHYGYSKQPPLAALNKAKTLEVDKAKENDCFLHEHNFNTQTFSPDDIRARVN